jgi:hypothetical protein
METHVHENEHDGRYTYDEIQCQNIDNQGERSCRQKTHMEKNKNPIYDYCREAKKESRDI